MLVLHAGDVALGNVAEFVRHHRSQFVAARDHRDQTKVHAHEPPRQGKRVDRPVSHQKHIPCKGFFLLGLQIAQLHGRVAQWLPNRLQVVQQDRVVHVVGVGHQLAHDGLAQAALLLHAHAVAVANIGQPTSVVLRLQTHRRQGNG